MGYSIGLYSTDTIIYRDIISHASKIQIEANLSYDKEWNIVFLVLGEYQVNFQTSVCSEADAILYESLRLIDVFQVKTYIDMRFFPRTNKAKYIGISVAKELMQHFNCIICAEEEGKLADEGNDEFNLENVDWLLDYFQRPD